MKKFKNSIIFLTGGTGSFGNAFTDYTLKKINPKKLIIFSRDESKQWDMAKKYEKFKNLEFVIGDIRDKETLQKAMKNSQYVIHAAATKIVPTAETNPLECIKTNILGSANVIDSAKINNVKRVVALSTDKACNPVNLYGATKLAADKLFVSSNQIKEKKK